MELNKLTQLELQHLLTLKVNELQNLVEKIDEDTEFEATALINTSIYKKDDIKNGIGHFATFGDDVDIACVLNQSGESFAAIANAYAKFKLFKSLIDIFDDEEKDDE